MPLFRSSSSFGSLCGKNIANHEETEEERFYKKLNNWKLPTVPIRQIYSKTDSSIKIIEQTITLSKEKETVQLFSKRSIGKQRKSYDCVHIGLVQVAIKPLSKESLNTSILLSLRDCRFITFDSSLLRAIETNLCNGPVYFDYYPNYLVSVNDILLALTLDIKTGSLPIALIYRVHCKFKSAFVYPKALRESPKEKTLLMQVDLTRSEKPNPIVICLNEVNFPENWLPPEEGSLEENEENFKPRRIF